MSKIETAKGPIAVVDNDGSNDERRSVITEND